MHGKLVNKKGKWFVKYKVIVSKDYDNPLSEPIYGICEVIHNLYDKDIISVGERCLLQINFFQNRPKWYNSLFWWDISYTGRVFWWTIGYKGMQQRKLFLQHLIKKYS